MSPLLHAAFLDHLNTWQAQDIESMEAQLKKLQEKRAEQDACAAVPSSTTGTAGETKETRQLTPLEEQQKRLAEAEERVESSNSHVTSNS